MKIIGKRTQNWNTAAKIYYLKMKHKSGTFTCSFKGWNWIAQCRGESPIPGGVRFCHRNSGGGIKNNHTDKCICEVFVVFSP